MDKTKIKYRNSNISLSSKKGTGEAILFVHGNSLSSDTFKTQFDATELTHLDLHAFDFLGHGYSDLSIKPEVDYTLPGLIDQLKFVIDSIEAEPMILVGHSLGGHVIIEALPDINKKIDGILIFGSPPISLNAKLEDMFLPNPTSSLLYKNELTEQEVRTMTQTFFNGSGAAILKLKKQIVDTDPTFREYLGKSVAKGEIKDEVEILKSSGVPLAILHGANDPIINLNYLKSLKLGNLWRKNVNIISNTGHSVQLENSRIFNKILLEFLSEI